jgi:hypothetical protein
LSDAGGSRREESWFDAVRFWIGSWRNGGADDQKIWRHRHLSTAIPFPELDWSDIETSLGALYDYAVQMANGTIDWYIRRRFWKKILSRGLHLASFVFVGAAALVSLLKIFSPDVELKVLQFFERLVFGSNGVSPGCNSCDRSGFAAEAALVLIGIATGFSLIDRLAGLSTGWMRYVMTAMRLEEQLVTFQFEWTRLKMEAAREPRAPAGSADDEGRAPKLEAVAVQFRFEGEGQTRSAALRELAPDPTSQRINLVRDFCARVLIIVRDETSVWADELRENVTNFAKHVASHHGQDAGKT